ncbi:DUF2061 domain-containing protein [Jiella pacifica]|uniref:DUF2061 domain-containing protein n=1 Tax=Jiella pacifica TaxID=2696469 RepID=A0A6N9T1P8_9HYPH|nr:DUF2061 domain-containing protein [Jiella pacifica]NDW05283.1 DUF2061 domain-containing protein [Jiella pacifica]
METRKRSFAKAVSWQGLGIVTMLALGFLFTGSLWSGGALAVLSSLLGFFSYLLHERVWASIGWGLAGDRRQGPTETVAAAERLDPAAARQWSPASA